MACPTVTLEGVTEEVMECLRREARARGLPAPDEERGTVTAFGASADFAWDPAAGTLSITVTRPPQGMDCASLERTLRQGARLCGAR